MPQPRFLRSLPAIFGFKQIALTCILLLSHIALTYAQVLLPTLEIAEGNKYGIEPFKPTLEAPYESATLNGSKIGYMEYILVSRDPRNGLKSEFHNWPLTETGAKTYRLSNQASRAVINVAFWGVTPKSGVALTLASPSQAKPSMLTFFTNIVTQSASSFINSDNMQDLTLLIIPIPKDSELNKYFTEELNKVHSEILYVLWNKKNEPLKPDFNGIQYTPSEFALTIPKTTSSKLIIQGPKTNITYSIFNQQLDPTKRTWNTNKSLDYNASTTQSIILDKPKGFNLIRKGDADTTAFLNDSLVIVGRAGSIDTVVMVPVSQQYVFIDASEIKNKSKVCRLLDSISSISGGFRIFLSHNNHPILAHNKTELLSLQSDLSYITFQTPTIVEDLKRFSILTNSAAVVKRLNIKYYLFLSYNTYSNDFSTIKNNLSEQCNCSEADVTFNVYLTIPPDELYDKTAGVNYVFLK